MFSKRHGSPTPDARKLYGNPYASVMANVNAYRPPVLTRRTQADVIEEFRRNLASFKGIYSAKDVKKALVNGWDEGDVHEIEIIEYEGGDGGSGGGSDDDGDADGGIHESKEEEPPPDFMSPPAPRKKKIGSDEDEEDEDGEDAAGEARVVKEGEDTPEAAHARFREMKYEYKDIPAEALGKSDTTLISELKEFAKELYQIGVIKTRFYYRSKQSFAENRARLSIDRLGYALPTAAAAPAAAPPTAAAPAASAVKSPVRRPLTPEVGGSPADMHLLMS